MHRRPPGDVRQQRAEGIKRQEEKRKVMELRKGNKAEDQGQLWCLSSRWDDAAALVFSDTIPSSARVAPDTWFPS